MTQGWTLLDQGIAIWTVAGFVLFTVAGLFQMQRLLDSLTKTWDRVSKTKESVFTALAPGLHRVLINPTTSGIIAGISFAMVSSGPAAWFLKEYWIGGAGRDLFLAIFFTCMAGYILVLLYRALRERLQGP